MAAKGWTKSKVTRESLLPYIFEGAGGERDGAATEVRGVRDLHELS
jgi:hypothetical protein